MEKHDPVMRSLDEHTRELYDQLHVLRLVHVKGSYQVSVEDEEILGKNFSQLQFAGFVKSEDRSGKRTYLLSEKASERMLLRLSQLHRMGSEIAVLPSAAPEILRREGYSERDYQLMRAILVDGEFDQAAVGIFSSYHKA